MLYGRFDEEALAPYQPVVEMVRGWSSGASLEPLRERLGVRAAELGILFGEFGPPPADHAEPGSPATTPTPAACASSTPWRRCSARSARSAPLVLVFDDLHWADRPTLQLLRHLVRSPQPRRALLLGTYRDAELEPGHPLHELIGDVRREGMLQRLELAGLAEPEVAELVVALGVPAAEPAFVHALHGETEGNPFFIEEVVRHLRESDQELRADVSLTEAGVPDGVREVTARRLRRLCAESRQALQVAAVIGREFDYDVLEAVAPLHDDALIGAMEEGVEARVLREAGRVGRYAFTHALVRATLYDGLSQLRRARLHGRVGEAISRLRSADLDPHLPQLAHHFAQAAPVEQPERAIDFALAAARRADRLLAWEEAAQHYRAALRARELAGAPRRPRARRAAARARRVRGSRRHGGGGARDVRRRRRDRARARRRVAARPRRARLRRPVVDPRPRRRERASELLEEALAALGDDDSPLRARLLARLALELYYSGDPERRLALSEEAVDLARRLGDPRTLRHLPRRPPLRAVAAGERATSGSRSPPSCGAWPRRPAIRSWSWRAPGWTVVDLLELGDVQGADVQIAAASKLAEALQRPIWLWWTSLLRCARAQLVGDFDEAERLADATLEVGRHGQAENAVNAYAQAMFNIRREQGRLQEVEPAVRRFIELYPALVAWRAALALLLVELGRMDEARAEFETLAARRPAARRELADRRDAARRGVRRARRRRRGRGAVRAARAVRGPQRGRGRAATCNGAASRLLGILAAAMRSWELAEGHFISALAMHERMGARPWVARTQLAYAEMLLARRQRGDKARARDAARRRRADRRRARDGRRGAAGAGSGAGGAPGRVGLWRRGADERQRGWVGRRGCGRDRGPWSFDRNRPVKAPSAWRQPARPAPSPPTQPQ